MKLINLLNYCYDRPFYTSPYTKFIYILKETSTLHNKFRVFERRGIIYGALNEQNTILMKILIQNIKLAAYDVDGYELKATATVQSTVLISLNSEL